MGETCVPLRLRDRAATAVADVAIEMSRATPEATPGERSRQIRQPEITIHPANPPGAPSVVLEAHVGIGHDDEQRLRRR
jgi:hypothetical protein